ncbi:MAG: hypothetical protein NVS2B7_28090 [Herpetosiphon sp.]
MLRRIFVLFVMLAVTAAGVDAVKSQSTSVQQIGLVYIPMVTNGKPPASRFIGAALPQSNWQTAIATTQRFQNQTGVHMAVLHGPLTWTFDFPTVGGNFALINGSTPFYSWEPGEGLGAGFGPNNCQTAYSTQNVINGNFDVYIRNFATAAKVANHAVLIDLASEMNNNQAPWSGVCNGGANGGPQKFVQAWRHVHDIFVQIGATNVKWIWTPVPVSYPTDSWNQSDNYYPGDQYVDWIGTKAFNWGASSIFTGAWLTLDQMAGGFIERMAKLHPDKPQIVTEGGSVDGDGGTRARWITDALASLAHHPQVQIFIYYNYNLGTYPVDGRAYDFSLDHDVASQQALAQGVQALQMNQYLYEGYSPTPIDQQRGTGASLGAYLDLNQQNLNAFDRLAQKHHPISMFYAPWSVPWYGTNGNDYDTVFKSWPTDRTPLFLWEPLGVPLARIIDGSNDAFLTNWARGIKTWGRPALIAWAQEPNDNQFQKAWSGSANGGPNGGPASYVAAWRHIHAIFDQQGATNVQWVWMPASQDSMPPSYNSIPAAVNRPDSTWNTFTNYYPGDDVVDWVGTLATNNGDNGGNFWAPVQLIVDRNLRNAAQLYPTKRQLVVLNSVEDTSNPSRKPGWIADSYNALKLYPKVEAVLWSQQGQSFNIDSTPDSLAAYRAAIADPYYKTSAP